MNDNYYESLKDKIETLGFTSDEADTMINTLETNTKTDLLELFKLEESFDFEPIETIEVDYTFNNITLDKLDTVHIDSIQLNPINHNVIANVKLKQLESKYLDIKIDTLNIQGFSYQPKLEKLNVSNGNVKPHLKYIDVTSSIAEVNRQLNSIQLDIPTKPFIKKDKSLQLPKNLMNKPKMKHDYRIKSFIEEPRFIDTLIELPSTPKTIEVTSHDYLEPINIEFPTEDIKPHYERELKSIGLDIELDDTIPMLSVANYYMDNVESFAKGQGISRHYEAFKGFYRPFIDDIATEVYQTHYACNDPIQLFELFKSRINDVIEEISEMYMEQDVQDYIMEG